MEQLRSVCLPPSHGSNQHRSSIQCPTNPCPQPVRVTDRKDYLLPSMFNINPNFHQLLWQAEADLLACSLPDNNLLFLCLHSNVGNVYTLLVHVYIKMTFAPKKSQPMH